MNDNRTLSNNEINSAGTEMYPPSTGSNPYSCPTPQSRGRRRAPAPDALMQALNCNEPPVLKKATLSEICDI